MTARSVVADFLGWIGLGAFAPGLPIPEIPANSFLAGLWVGMRRLHYTLHNSYPTLSLVTPTSDPATGVITGNLGGADADGDVLTYAVSNGSHGTVAIGADGTYTYTPDATFAHTGGTDTFTASVSDTQNPWHIHAVFGTIVHHLFSALNWAGVLNPDTKQVTVTIPAGFANAAPVANAPVLGTANASTGAVTGSVAVTDADSDSAEFAVSTAPLRGTLQVTTTGGFVYTPNATARHAASAQDAPAEALVDTFTIAVSDGYGGTTLVPVTVNVDPANANPAAGVPTIGVPNVTTGVIAGTLAITDADGDTTAVTATTGPLRGTVTVDQGTGAFSYTPNAVARHAASAQDAPAGALVDTFTLAVSDGHGGTTLVPITVAIDPANNDPTTDTPTVGTPDAQTGAIAGQLVASDGDGDTTAVTAVTSPTRGVLTLNQVTGAFTYTPNAEARHAAAAAGATANELIDTFTLAVTDGHGGTTLVPVTVEVSPANAAPVAAAPTVAEPNASTGVVTGELAVTDTDGDTASYSIVDGPSNGTVTIDPVTGAFVYTPTEGARHNAAQESGSTGSGLQTITLSNPAAVTEGTYGGWRSGGGTYNYVATFFTAAETGTYIFGQTSAPVDTVMELYSGTFDPSAPGVGRLAVNDDTGLSAHTDAGATVTGCAGSTGLCPQVRTDLTAGQVITLVVTTYSPGAPLGLPQSFYSNRGGTFSATAPGDSFTIAVDDGHGGVTTRRISVPILPANIDPTAIANVGTPDGSTGAVAGTLVASDADGDTTAVAAVTTPTRGTLTVDPATGEFTYTPDAVARHAAAADDATAADLADTFTLAVTDGHGGTVVTALTVAIVSANTDPVAVVNTCERDCIGGGGLGSVTASDADGDTLTYAVTSGPSSGSVTIDSETGDFTYTPGSSASQAQVAAVEVAAIQTAAVSDPGVLPSGALGTVTGNAVDTWETYSFIYTPSTTGANFIGFAFRQDPAYWTFDNAQLFETGSAVNLFTNSEFSSGGAVSITTNNGPSSIQAPSNWGVWYQDGTYPAAAGTWDGGSWYDGAVGTFDGIYQGVDLIAGTGYTIRFDVSGNDVANLDDIQLGVYGGTCQDSGSPATSCTVPASSGFATLARPDQTQNAGVTSPSWSADSFEVTVTDGHGGSLVVPVTVAAC